MESHTGYILLTFFFQLQAGDACDQGLTGRVFQLRVGYGSGIGKNILGRIGYGLGTGIGII